MKVIFLLALFISAGFFAFAQTTFITPENMTTPVYEMPYYSSLVKKPVSKMTRSVAEGSIYTSPLDNMPCVIPTISSVEKMPVLETYLPNRGMPNPYTKSVIFPTLVIKLSNTLTK